MEVKVLFRLIFEVTGGYNTLVQKRRKGKHLYSKERLRGDLSTISISEPPSHTLQDIPIAE